METNIISGLLLILLAGTCSGTFALPFKKNRSWLWENNWFVWSLVALLIAPWVVTLLTIPDLMTIYQSNTNSLYLACIFGLLWGIGAILFGKGIDLLGVSLSLPIMQGLINVVGTIMPVALRNPAELLTSAGLRLLAGVAVILVGIILFARAGKLRDCKVENEIKNTNHSTFKRGLIICLLAGIFGPMINFAFVYGAPLQQKAIELGSTPIHAANVIWSVALTAGFLVNALECIRLFRKHGSWKIYRKHRLSGWVMAGLAGVLWYLSIMFYGMGGSCMGESGASVGWAAMQSIAIIAGNVAGIIAGEWKGASSGAIRNMIAGLICLITGVIIIAS